jgi:hypothetical protein
MVGEDNRAILSHDLGYSEQQLDDLQAAGILIEDSELAEIRARRKWRRPGVRKKADRRRRRSDGLQGNERQPTVDNSAAGAGRRGSMGVSEQAY